MEPKSKSTSPIRVTDRFSQNKEYIKAISIEDHIYWERKQIMCINLVLNRCIYCGCSRLLWKKRKKRLRIEQSQDKII